MKKQIGWAVMLMCWLSAGSLEAQTKGQAPDSSKRKLTEAERAEKVEEFRKAHSIIIKGVFKPSWDTKFLPGYPIGGGSYCGRYRAILPFLRVINQAEGLDPTDFEIQQQWNLHLAWFYENCNTEVSDKMKPDLMGSRVPPGCPNVAMAIYPGRFEEAYLLYEKIARAFGDKVQGGVQKDIQRVAHRIALYHQAQYVERGDESDLCQAREWRVWYGLPDALIRRHDMEAKAARKQMEGNEKLNFAREKVAKAEEELRKAQRELAEEERKRPPQVAQQKN